MPVVYSSLQQTQIDQSNYPQYGITKPDETEYSYFPVDFDPLKYCGGHRNMAKTDYLFVSTTGNLKDATFFGKVEKTERIIYIIIPTLKRQKNTNRVEFCLFQINT